MPTGGTDVLAAGAFADAATTGAVIGGGLGVADVGAGALAAGAAGGAAADVIGSDFAGGTGGVLGGTAGDVAAGTAATAGPATATFSAPAVADAAVTGLSTGGEIGSTSFLPATTGATASALSPATANLVGIAPESAPILPDAGGGVGAAAGGGGGGGLSLDNPAFGTTAQDAADLQIAAESSTMPVGATGVPGETLTSSGPAVAGGGGIGTQTANLLKSLGITNPAQAGLLGISAMNALKQPQLPGSLKQVATNAGEGQNAAQSIINSGGTSSPNWANQKASIDASIDQQLQEQSEALAQSAVNNGNTGMVQQQQLNQLKQNLETQRQQLYQQALTSNVNAAVAELTGDNQALTSNGQVELAQSQDARASAAQTAALSMQLSALSKTSP